MFLGKSAVFTVIVSSEPFPVLSSLEGYLEYRMGGLWNWTSLPCYELLAKTSFFSFTFLLSCSSPPHSPGTVDWQGDPGREAPVDRLVHPSSSRKTLQQPLVSWEFLVLLDACLSPLSEISDPHWLGKKAVGFSFAPWKDPVLWRL